MKKLTKEKAIELVSYIKDIKDDDEAAHSEEDDLRAWFITCCASRIYSTRKEMIEIAIEINKTKNIDFARWCA